MQDKEREMYDFAYTLTQSAGVKLKIERKHSSVTAKEKTSQMDLVTEQDLWIEKYLVESILKNYPEHGILAEEGHHDENEIHSGYEWVIDPIDGTVNYYRFGKDYAVSLALYKQGSPVFGIVYDVTNDMMFSARHGEGAGINGCRISEPVHHKDCLKEAVVAMSLRTMNELSGMGTDVLSMLSRVQAFRYLGCASLELCKVANGEYDLFISSNVHEWDVAAARVFLEQRGGILISRKKTKEGLRSGKLMVAAYRSPRIWEEALEHLPQNVKTAFGY